jgi:hypothetical protein
VTTPQHESKVGQLETDVLAIHQMLGGLQAGQRRADLGIAMLADQIDELDGRVSEILDLLRKQQPQTMTREQ